VQFDGSWMGTTVPLPSGMFGSAYTPALLVDVMYVLLSDVAAISIYVKARDLELKPPADVVRGRWGPRAA
jgi:hypothetical protein